MRHFKLPLIVTGIVFLLAIVIGVLGMMHIFRATNFERERMARAEKLATGLATATCIVIAPFWIIAAGKFGKERRMAREVTSSGSPEQ